MISKKINFKTDIKNKEKLIEHTRISYTRNLIGLSLDDFFK